MAESNSLESNYIGRANTLVEILYKEESYKIVGACFEVYNELGSGFVESVSQESLELEFGLSGVPFEAQKRLIIQYKGNSLKQKFIPDFICFGEIILEIKAVSQLTDVHRAQLHNYLKATGYRLGGDQFW